MKRGALIACRSSMVRREGSVDFEATQRTFDAVFALLPLLESSRFETQYISFLNSACFYKDVVKPSQICELVNFSIRDVFKSCFGSNVHGTDQELFWNNITQYF